MGEMFLPHTGPSRPVTRSSLPSLTALSNLRLQLPQCSRPSQTSEKNNEKLGKRAEEEKMCVFWRKGVKRNRRKKRGRGTRAKRTKEIIEQVSNKKGNKKGKE